MCPLTAARCNGEERLPERLFTSAPSDRSASTAVSLPDCAAKCKGVFNSFVLMFMGSFIDGAVVFKFDCRTKHV